MRLDDEADRALRVLEATGLSQSEAIRTALLAEVRHHRRNREIAAVAAGLEADEQIGKNCSPSRVNGGSS